MKRVNDRDEDHNQCFIKIYSPPCESMGFGVVMQILYLGLRVLTWQQSDFYNSASVPILMKVLVKKKKEIIIYFF